MKKYYIIFIFVVFPLCLFSAEENSPLDITEKVEKNLIYSKEIIKDDVDKSVIIQKGKWNEDTTKELDKLTEEEKSIVAEVKKTKEDKRVIALKRKAYDAINIGEYEVAVKLYKDALKIDKTDVYSKLGLATAYQYLGQYTQAKPLYLELLEKMPDDQQIISNILSIVTIETPYEAVYLLSNIAEKNLSSPLIQAQTSVAYTKVKNYDKAIEYIERAITLDPDNIEYKYNLAVLHDMNNDTNLALYEYKELLDSNYLSNSFSRKDIKERIDTLEAMKNKKKK